jgi:two-component system, OmpR family, copper resistance phosphate regulon response regulator CusR
MRAVRCLLPSESVAFCHRRRYHHSVRLLVVENEPKTAAFLRKGLGEQGFMTDVANDGDQGFEMARASDYDLVILDIMLPGRDGWSVLSSLRSAGKRMPVLFLTARDSVAERVRGLEMGADDYLVKPFAFSELLARIRTIIRRVPQLRSHVLRFADIELDPISHKAFRGGKRLDLTLKEFLLLALFVTHPDEVLTRATIAEQVWDMSFDTGTNIVEVHVRRLRAKMDDPFERKLIRTVRGVGYVLKD